MRFPFPIVVSFLLLGLSFLGSLRAAEGNEIQPTLQALPFQFNNGILQVSGKQGTPCPSQWIVIARDADDMGTITQLTIADGQTISQRPSFNLGQMFREEGFFQAADVLVDAGTAFATARRALSSGGGAMVQADYRLGRPSSDLAPVWTVTGRDASGRVVGIVRISAQSGMVLDAQMPSQRPSSSKP